MSYILDALRKSEQERQVASGRGVGMLFPVMADHASKRGPNLPLLAGAMLLSCAIIIPLVWWIWSGHSATAHTTMSEKSAVVVATAPPPPVTPVSPVASETPVATATPARARKSAIAQPPAPLAAKSSVEPVAKKTNASANSDVLAAPPATVAVPGNQGESGTEQPKGMPKLVISGFINDEQGENLAIINDKLVREGEEVAPGLRLEKIIDESAVFTYKGQRFRR